MSNVDTARATYQAFAKGDLATLKEAFAQDAYWYSSAAVRPGGALHGRDAIMEMMAALPDHWSEVSVEPREFIDAGDRVVVLGTQRFANDRGSAESPYVQVLKFNPDGKVVHSEFHADSAAIAQLQR